MNLESINKRIKAIADLQNGFGKRVADAEKGLLVQVLANFENLRSKLFPTFKKVWNSFLEEKYIPLIESFVDDMRSVVDANEIYFGKEVPAKGLFERLGITEAGAIKADGYVSTVLQDQTAKRELQQFLSRTKQLKSDQKVKEDVIKLIEGQKAHPKLPARPGIIQKFTDQSVLDSYNEADSIIQNDFATVNFMDAGMYTGGLIEGTRPFCKERNRKVFLRSEIVLFGTPEDKFGGYSNKSIGMFNGKPKAGYDPFLQRGGYRCRHHWSWLANEYAIRQDKTLIEVDGKLRRIS